MRFLLKVFVAAVLTGVVLPVFAQGYPNRPVRIVAPFAPGGSTDVLTRIVGQKLNGRWRQTVIVDNRVGASGNIGAEHVAKSSAADGHTLLMAGSPHAIGVSLFKNLRYDLEKDLAPIGAVAMFPNLLVAHPALPVKTVKDLIALAKARPGELNFGSPNIGSPNHLAMELFKTMAKVNMVHIPYKGGSGQMVGDLVAGHVQLASMGFPPAIPQVKAGKLRAIAVTGAKRSPLLPEVPTVSEAGLPGFDVSSWYGVFAPMGLPRDLVTKLNGDIVAILGEADLKERLASLGAEPMPMSPEDFGHFVREEVAKWAKVVKESGAKAD
ncbi:MAG: tripartite tricarboxylate transporter substrate binding protein [Pseudomonadota bacterium]